MLRLQRALCCLRDLLDPYPPTRGLLGRPLHERPVVLLTTQFQTPATSGPPSPPGSASRRRLSHEFKVNLIVTLIITVLAAGSAPWWWKYTPWAGPDPVASSTPTPALTPTSSSSPTASASSSLPPGVLGMSGGCDGFQVYAQGRWDARGAVVRAAPNKEAKIVDRFAVNESMIVNGWVHSRPALPMNTSPWNSDIWFHMSDDSGWVSFPGVRERPVNYDPSGLSKDGGTPAPTLGKCRGAIQ